MFGNLRVMILYHRRTFQAIECLQFRPFTNARARACIEDAVQQVNNRTTDHPMSTRAQSVD